MDGREGLNGSCGLRRVAVAFLRSCVTDAVWFRHRRGGGRLRHEATVGRACDRDSYRGGRCSEWTTGARRADRYGRR